MASVVPVARLDSSSFPFFLLKTEWPNRALVAVIFVVIRLDRLYRSTQDRAHWLVSPPPVSRGQCLPLWHSLRALPTFASEHVIKSDHFLFSKITANDWFPTLFPGMESLRPLARVSFIWLQTCLSDYPISQTWSVLIVTWFMGPKQNGFALLAPACSLTLQLECRVDR